MTRKDYEAVATAISTAIRTDGTIQNRSVVSKDEYDAAAHAYRMVTTALVSAFAWGNPRFDPDRFREAALAPLETAEFLGESS